MRNSDPALPAERPPPFRQAMDLRRLRYFEAVARTGNFTAAAESLNVSQPALSYHIKLLETELGVHLLDRHAKGASLTPAGVAFARDVRRIFRELANADRNLDQFRKARPQVLRLGMTPTAGRLLGPEILAATVEAGGYQVSLHEGLTSDLMADLEAGRIDAAVCYQTPANAHLANHPLYEEDLVLVGAAHLLPPGRDIRFDELARLQLLIDHNLHLTRQMLDFVSADRGVPLRFTLEVDASQIKRELIKNHSQFSVVPFGYVSDIVGPGQLAVRRIVRPTLTCRMVMLPRRDFGTESVEFLLDCLLPPVHRRIDAGTLGWRLPEVNRRQDRVAEGLSLSSR